MELEERPTPVDPEVRAYVYSLVSALGGTGTDEDGRYVLGDDALACLKDIKRWLKLYDEKANRLDVARCLAEANLVEGDLLEILGSWPEEATDDKFRSKIALACLELLVPLTWPIEKSDDQMTVNHHKHIPYIQLAQTSYKRALLEGQSNSILRTGVRTALPSIAVPMRERSSRDEGIIKLLLYLFRNVSIITAAGESKDSPTSRSATIEAFHHQDVLALILTICSNMGEDFDTQDTVILELLFHLLKGVNIEKLFMNEAQLQKNGSNELGALLAKEKNMHRSYLKHAPSRHNRFGTMIWVKRDEPGKVSTVSGQGGLTDTQRTLRQMDQSKKWNKPRQGKRGVEKPIDRFDIPITLSPNATTHLRNFVEEFLDSSFNPLFNHIRRAIEREADRVLEVHKQQYFYLVSWFLEAERVRRRKKQEAQKKSKDRKISETFEADSFALIASVLNQETFLLLNRFMQNAIDMKEWQEVHAGTRAFTQILMIVQEMAESSLEEDQEIAENIQNRIFYEETTHDRIIAILRGYKDQGFGYLDSCTELSHVFLRMLERYSRENVDLQVRSKRRARRKKKAEADLNNPIAKAENEDNDDDAASEMEDVVEAQQTSKERKFDFKRFAAKFMTQPCVDTFLKLTRFYNDLTTEQLKRAHRFFYRIAFKQELSVMLFRVDYFTLFYRMIKGPDPLDRTSPMFGEWDELIKQLTKRMVKKMQERPELAVEMLFSKIPATVFYLENGYEKQTMSSKPRPPAVLEVRGEMTRDEQIGVAVAVCIGEDDIRDALGWITKSLSSAASERQSWEAESAARKADNPESSEPESKAPSIVLTPNTEPLRVAMFKSSRLRLLLTLAGFERLGIDDEPNVTWIIPSALTASQLKETHDIIQRHVNNPKMEYEDSDTRMALRAEDLLRRKTTDKPRRADFDDDDSGDDNGDDADADLLFPPGYGGPTDTGPRTAAAALEKLKKKRRLRRKATATSDDDGVQNRDPIDEDTRARRRKLKAQADREKMAKIKSAEFVYDSDEDEEADREFFAREEMRREGQKRRVMHVLREGMVGGAKAKAKGKRKSDVDNEGKKANRKKRRVDPQSDDEGDDIDVMMDEEPSSGDGMHTRKKGLETQSDDDLDTLMNGGASSSRVGHTDPAHSSSSPQIRDLDLNTATEEEGEEEETPLSTPLDEVSQEKDVLRDIPPNVQGTDKTSELSKPADTDGGGVEEEEDDGVVLPSRWRGRKSTMFESDSDSD